MIPGKEITIGGVKRVMPPLNAAAFKANRESVSKLLNGPDAMDLELLARLAHAALRRNYPEITLEDVEDAVDFGNAFDVFEAMIDLSALAARTRAFIARSTASDAPK